MRVSFLLPAYNEAATIREVLERMDALGLDRQIVVVDDGSTDDTARIVEEYGGVTLARLLPSSPAGIGLFEAATVVALHAYAVLQSTALPYALVLHALNLFPFLLIGGALLLGNRDSRWSLAARSTTRRRGRASNEPVRVPDGLFRR